MVLRIQYRHLARLAQRQARPPTLTTQLRLQQFSTSRTYHHQDPKPTAPLPPVPETPPTTETAPTTTTTTTTTPPPAPPKTKKRLISRAIFATAFLLLGLAAGSSARLLLTPPAPPEPGTEEDAYTTQVLHEQAARLPIVQHLSSDPSWESWEAYESLSEEHKAQHITAGVLRGARGVGGYQRVFWNRGTGELVSVIFFGAATAGWPGVVHGGCLATVLDESCGRAAFKQWGGRGGFTARLDLSYKRVTLANGFYVVRVRPRREEELPDKEKGKGHYKCFVDATVEDAATGTVTVAAEALFVASGGKDAAAKGKKDLLGWEAKKEEHQRF